MFDREEHIKMKRKIMTHWSEEQFQQDADFMEEKYSHIKKGENVVHINHLGQIFTSEDLTQIETQLKTIDYELSRFDNSGIMMNSAQDIVSEVVLFINDPTVQKSILISAVWDAIKAVGFIVWNKTHGMRYQTFSSNKVVEKKISFSIKLKVNETDSFEFKTDNIPQDQFEKSLDKILELIKSNKQSEIPKGNQITIYNPIEQDWEIVDLTEELVERLAKDKFISETTMDEFKKQFD